MKRALSKISNSNKLYYFNASGEKVFGVPSCLSGNVSCLSGNVTGLSGNVSCLSGDVSFLRGNVTGLSGNVTGLSGNVDDCDITRDDRLKGVNVTELVSENS